MENVQWIFNQTGDSNHTEWKIPRWRKAAQHQVREEEKWVKSSRWEFEEEEKKGKNKELKQRSDEKKKRHTETWNQHAFTSSSCFSDSNHQTTYLICFYSNALILLAPDQTYCWMLSSKWAAKIINMDAAIRYLVLVLAQNHWIGYLRGEVYNLILLAFARRSHYISP